MKKIIILLLLFTCLFGCRQRDDVLTEIRNNGKGGISCLVNGEILVPKKSGGWFGAIPKHLIIYSHKEDTTTNMRVSFYNEGRDIWINIHDIMFYDKQTYERLSLAGTIFQLGKYDRDNGTSYGEYSELWEKNTYHTSEILDGELEVTFHDLDNYVVSGTFWFDAINDEGEIVEIRDGRFDMKIE